MLNINPNLCSGCALCENLCPQKCISMTTNEEGFLYPSVNAEECINCDICNQVCPVKTSIFHHEKKYYALQIEDNNVLSKCASGGAFATFARTVIENGGAVCGVSRTGNRIEFKIIDSYDGIYPLLNSKYYQCPLTSEVYDLIDKLDTNKYFLFSGTPCQVAAIEKKYRKKFADKLITVELICQGTNSENVVNYFINSNEKKRRAKVVDHYFRSKDKLVGRNYLSKYIYDNGFIEYSLGDSDNLTMSFQNKIFLRESCYNCAFTNPNRVADITIGDLWEYDLKSADIIFDKGVSVVITNTIVGELVLTKSQKYAFMERIGADSVKYNLPFNCAVKRPFTRAFSYKLVNLRLPVNLILFICCTYAYIKRIIKTVIRKGDHR